MGSRSRVGACRAAALLVALVPGPGVAASELECEDLAQRRLAAGPLDRRQLDGFLFQAADRGCAVLTGRLLDEGASVSARDRSGDTALHRAATAGETDTLRVLLARGGVIDQRTSSAARRSWSRARRTGRGSPKLCSRPVPRPTRPAAAG